MGLPERKYSDEQKAAMLYVRNQGGTYAENAAQLAREGCPPLDVGPFEVPPATLRGEVPRMLRAQATAAPLEGRSDVMAETLAQRVLALANAELSALERRRANVDLKRLDDISKIVQRHRIGARKPAATSDPENPEAPGPDPEPEPSPFMAQLAGDRPSQEADDSEAEADPDDVPTHPLGLGPATTAAPPTPVALPQR